MSHENTNTCQVCQTANGADAIACVQCGTLLTKGATVVIADKPVGASRLNHLAQLIREHSDGLVLHLATHDQSILVKGPGGVVLGRDESGEAQAMLDLTRYDARLLGVSRRHAKISVSDEGYVIEDLGSTNGTAVNEKRLVPNTPHPLRNGDLIRLGQLLLFAYFTTATKESPLASAG